MITTTRHAIERYNERVCPTRQHRDAMRMLDDALLDAVVTTKEPWLGCEVSRGDRPPGSTTWAVIHDGEVALPLEKDKSGRVFAVTCLARCDDE